MGEFGWAYVAGGAVTGALGPTGSVLLKKTETTISGSNRLIFNTSSADSYVLELSGNLYVSSSLTASTMHLPRLPSGSAILTRYLALDAEYNMIVTSSEGGGTTYTAGDGLDLSGTEFSVDLKSAGGLKITSGEIEVEPSDFAGTGLEDDGSDNLRIAGAAAGDGLAGGGGSALSVGAGTSITVNANDVQVSDGGITGTQLNSSVAGDGLTGGGGSALAVGAGTSITVNANDVQVSDGGITGTQLNSSVAGDGLAGGGGTALSVDLKSSGGLKITSGEIEIEPNDFAGSGLEDDGSDNLRIASSAAGDGLTGGGGSALAVGAGTSITVNANDVQVSDGGITGTQLNSSVAGDGLTGGGGSALSVDLKSSGGLKITSGEIEVEPSDFAGAGLEDDGSDNLRIAAAAAGDGLQGGGGSALAVDVSDFAGSGLEDDGSENLRIAASAAGSGLTGGGGSALSWEGITGVTQAGGSTVNNVTTLVFTGSTVTDNSGGQVTITPVIGAAEDGSYADGLFTDFAYTTPIGTAIDRINEVLKGIAPSSAPSLDDADCNDSGTSAKLSFGNTQSIGGYTNARPSTLSSPSSNLSDVDINGSFSSTIASNDVRIACFNGSTVIDGTLNADVSADSPNYAADAFGNGDQGTLKLFVNNNSTEIHSTDLSSFGSGTSANGNGSGFVLSAVTNGAFSDGSAFSTFKHRTGTYTIAVADQRNGWNYARITHTVGSTTTTTNYIEWINDPDSNALSSDNAAMDSLSMTGTKHLSGIKYNTGGSAEYRVRVLNAYRNVYSTSNITFTGTNCSVPSQAFPSINTGGGETEAKNLNITGSVTINADPILNGSISVSVNVPAPLKLPLSNASSQSISGILLYNLSDTSTATSESFRGESYRRVSGSYSNQASITAGGSAWDSTTSLLTVDGLQYYNSRLVAPRQTLNSGDFRNTSDGGSITNGPSSNLNYSGISSGVRSFFRHFQNTSGGSKTGFSLTINGSGTIVSQAGSLSTSNIRVFCKLPTTSDGFETGWMDLAVAFATGQTSDGDGCLEGTFDSSLNANNSVTFGTESVGDDDYVVIKIEADASWTGHITSISVSWS